MRVALPSVTNMTDNVKAHTFPLKIAYQTHELMQATLFHAMLADEAAGQRIRQPNALEEIEESLMQAGLKKDLWEEGWKYLIKYQSLIEKMVTQNVLIALRSHWDWYIRNLGAFVEASIKATATESLAKHAELTKIGFKDILKQLSILEESATIVFNIPEVVKASVREMSLVRNLGLHNRWEVDDYYLQKTKSTGWEIRQVRVFELPELQEWHRALALLINATWSPLAVKFKNAPSFELDGS